MQPDGNGNVTSSAAIPPGRAGDLRAQPPADGALRSRRMVLPADVPGGMPRVVEGLVVWRAGRITQVVEGADAVRLATAETARRGTVVEDVGDLAVLPGLVDAHVHINEPGRTEWEGFRSATRAAAAGGVTLLGDMPLNSSPVTTTLAGLRAKIDAARAPSDIAGGTGKLHVDVALHGGVVPGNEGELAGLAAAGVTAFKAFLCHSGLDEFPDTPESALRTAMRRIAPTGLPLMVHAELVAPIPQSVTDAWSARPTDYRAFAATRPVEWELSAIALVLRLCRETGCPVHVVHLATGDGRVTGMLRGARAEGLPVTVETCPHYLTATADEVPAGDARYKCAPPLRTAADRAGLWAGLRDGLIDTVGSDHSPAPPDMKLPPGGDLSRAWGGIAGVQLTLPMLLTGTGRGATAGIAGASLPEVVRWACEAPSRLLGLSDRKGVIKPGADADLVVLDPEATWTVEAGRLHFRHPTTCPWLGRTLRGEVRRTLVRGTTVWRDGAFTGASPGDVVLREGAHKSGALG